MMCRQRPRPEWAGGSTRREPEGPSGGSPLPPAHGALLPASAPPGDMGRCPGPAQPTVTHRRLQPPHHGDCCTTQEAWWGGARRPRDGDGGTRCAERGSRPHGGCRTAPAARSGPVRSGLVRLPVPAHQDGRAGGRGGGGGGPRRTAGWAGLLATGTALQPGGPSLLWGPVNSSAAAALAAGECPRRARRTGVPSSSALAPGRFLMRSARRGQGSFSPNPGASQGLL